MRFVEPLGLSVTDAARVLGVSRPALSALLHEPVRLSSEMAIRIEKAFGVSMATLLRMQNSYDIAQAREQAVEIEVALYSGQSAWAKRIDFYRDRAFGENTRFPLILKVAILCCPSSDSSHFANSCACSPFTCGWRLGLTTMSPYWLCSSGSS